MSSFKFLQKRMVLWIHRCLVFMLSFSLGACTHFSNTVSNNKNEAQRNPAQDIPFLAAFRGADMRGTKIENGSSAFPEGMKGVIKLSDGSVVLNGRVNRLGQFVPYVSPNTPEQRTADQIMNQLREGRILSPSEMDTLFDLLIKSETEGVKARKNKKVVDLSQYVVHDLLGENIDLMRDSKGNTLLHFAASNPGIYFGAPFSDLAERSDPTVKNNEGKTALEIARQNKVSITPWVYEELVRKGQRDGCY